MSDHRAITETSSLDEETKQFIVAAVRKAIDLDNLENDLEYEKFHQRQIALALQKYHDTYFLSTRKLITDAVHQALKEGQVRFDDRQLRGQIHQVLNGRLHQDLMRALRENERNQTTARNIELTRVISTVFNQKLAEATFIVGQEFMESDKAFNRMLQASMQGNEIGFEETKEELVALMKETVEEVLRDNPMQFVQNVYAPDNLDPAEVFRATKGLLNGDTTPEPEPTRPEINFDRLSHQQLGDWAAVNDLVQEWQFDTIMVRRLLAMKQRDGKLEWPPGFFYDELIHGHRI